MSGINTVSGLKNVSIDYRPQVGPNEANAAGAQKQAADEIPCLGMSDSRRSCAFARLPEFGIIYIGNEITV